MESIDIDMRITESDVQRQFSEDARICLAGMNAKPVLQKIYDEFFTLIIENLLRAEGKNIIEIGAGSGRLKQRLPEVICTDIFPSPYCDRIESAYEIGEKNDSVSDIILIDVFHHLKFAGAALREFFRVLTPGGRVIILEPCISPLSLFVFGIFHHEPLGLREEINLETPYDALSDTTAYAAQSLPTRIFFDKRHSSEIERNWNIRVKKRLALWRYVFSGGFRKPQLYPDMAYEWLKPIDMLADLAPSITATRMLVVLEKPRNTGFDE